MKKLAAALLMFALLLCGCAAKQQKPAEAEMQEMLSSYYYSFTDDMGSEITLIKRPQRVAALIGSFADIWMLAGGEVCASADDAWDDFDLDMPEAAVNIGGTKQPSLELLFSADPDFVLASANTRANIEWKDTFESAGIPTAYFNVSDLDDYLRVLKICTDITGREDLYAQNGLEIKAQVQDAIDRSHSRINGEKKAPQVLLLRASASILKAKGSKDNVAGEMLSSLGCENIAELESSLLENLSLERIMQIDPDHIFIVAHGDDTEGMQKMVEQNLLKHPAWNELSAVKEGRVYYLEKRLYSMKPNARWGEAYQKLERILADG